MFKIKGLDQAFDRRCSMCKKNHLPFSPDYINMGGKEVPICKDCGDILDGMNTMKTGDDSWLRK
jgi:hypothetical protein